MMRILVINSGSSSIKFSVFEGSDREPLLVSEGELSGIGTSESHFIFKNASGENLRKRSSSIQVSSPRDAVEIIFAALHESAGRIDALGYRVVHPGPRIDAHCILTEEVMQDIREAISFAPLHDAAVIEVIEYAKKQFPSAGHYACFDTIFHQSMPEPAKTYAIPRHYREQGVRRYGFHGLSCESIVLQLREEEREGRIQFPRRMVIAHLGSGCSVTAAVDGRSVDTTMGLTPAGGVVMGTRPGDLDPGLVIYLLRQMKGDSATEMEKMLNHDAGIVAVSELPNDMKAVRKAAADGDAKARLAIDIFVRSVKKAIGGFAALMEGLDALVFTGGIGEHDTDSRKEIAGALANMGISLDAAKNKEGKAGAVYAISTSDSATAVYVVPAQEDRVIALHVQEMAGRAPQAGRH